MSMYTSTKGLYTQSTLKECNLNVNVRYLYSTLFHKDSKRFTTGLMGDLFMAQVAAVTVLI